MKIKNNNQDNNIKYKFFKYIICHMIFRRK